MMAKGTRSRVMLSSVVAVLAGMAALSFQPAPAVAQGMAGQSITGGLSNVHAGPNVTQFDKFFVLSVLETNNVEEQLGQLALQKSQSPDIKQFAQQMSVVRETMDQGYKPLADDLGLRPPKDPSKKYKQVIAKLSGLSGDQFDQEYIKAVLDLHKNDTKTFKTEADSSQDPFMERTATTDAAANAQHLLQIMQIAQAHNVADPAPKR